MGKVLVVVTLGRRFCVIAEQDLLFVCLLYTSDAADE